jgi:hypothetical protein
MISNPMVDLSKERDKTCFICFEIGKKKKGKLTVLSDKDDGFWIEQYFCDEHVKAVQAGKIKLGNIWITEKMKLKDLFRDKTDMIYSDGKIITKYVNVLVPFDEVSAK